MPSDRDGPRAVRLPWSEPNSRFTALFEGIAIGWLKVASQNAVAEQMGLSWDEVHAIQERAVARGLARRQQEVMAHLGVGEKSFTRGHRYFTLVNDLEGGRVLFVGEGRTEASLDGFWATLSEEQQAGVRAIAMDMLFRTAEAPVPAGTRVIVVKMTFASVAGNAHPAAEIDNVSVTLYAGGAVAIKENGIVNSATLLSGAVAPGDGDDHHPRRRARFLRRHAGAAPLRELERDWRGGSV
jgi:hypothetical protein